MPRTMADTEHRPQPLSAERFAHMVRRGLKRLQKAHAHCQRSANPENVHRLRRSIRHVRTLLDICAHREKRDRWRKPHVHIRQLLHALGPLRDLQVRTGLLRDLVETHPALLPLLRRAMKEEREERKAVIELMAQFELHELGTLRRRMRHRGTSGPPRPALMRTIASETHELRARWKGMRPNDPRSMHRVRVALRRLTHLLTTFAPHLRSEFLQDLPALRRMQLQLGQAHDMQLLLDWTAGVVMKLPVAQRAAVAAFADRSARSLDRRMAAFVRRHPDAGV